MNEEKRRSGRQFVITVTGSLLRLHKMQGSSLAASSMPTAGGHNRESGVVLAEFYRVWPLAGLALALVVTVCSMAILGYVAIKLL